MTAIAQASHGSVELRIGCGGLSAAGTCAACKAEIDARARDEHEPPEGGQRCGSHHGDQLAADAIDQTPICRMHRPASTIPTVAIRLPVLARRACRPRTMAAIASGRP